MNKKATHSYEWLKFIFCGKIKSYFDLRMNSGGAERSRTALDGFAIRCITALLTRHAKESWVSIV